MHFYLAAVGSAGDVHPLVGIGRALGARGHRVTLATFGYFATLARQAGLEFLDPIPDLDFGKIIGNPDLWHPVKGGKVLFEMMREAVEPMCEALGPLHVPGETVFVASSLALGARAAQEAYGIPLATVHLSPCFFRSRYHSPRFFGQIRPEWMPGFLKDWQYQLLDSLVIDRFLGPAINKLLETRGRPPARSILGDWLHSPQLVLALFPDWFAAPQPEWPPQTLLTGFPLYDERESVAVTEEVERFLAAGSPPIVFTPGSANVQREAGRFFQAACEACERLGRRGVLLTRFREQLPPRFPDQVRHFDFVPFSALLPRCAAIVHHGGIGTMAQGLAAGIPQLVMRMAFDQHDNAHRLQQLGCGRSLLPFQFRGRKVAAALKDLLESPAVRANCQRSAQRIAAMSPLDTICLALEQFAADQAAKPAVRDPER